MTRVIGPLYNMAFILPFHFTDQTHTGHRVCCLAAAPTPPSHCAAVLRKLGADRAQVEAAFAHLPLLLPLGEHHRGPTGLSAVLQQAAEFLGSGGGGCGVLVLDDASLVGGVLDARAAVELVQACRALLHGPGVMADRPTSLLVRAMDAKGDDAEGAAVAPLLLRHADALVEVRPLASGYSRDVHGLVRAAFVDGWMDGWTPAAAGVVVDRSWALNDALAL